MHPLKLLHIHFLTTESGKTNKDINVLVVTDHFTNYMQVYVTQSQMVSVVALWDKIFVYYRFLEKIPSDKGKTFEGSLVAELCQQKVRN